MGRRGRYGNLTVAGPSGQSLQKRFEPVAQLVEHRTFNAVVAGSSPARLTITSSAVSTRAVLPFAAVPAVGSFCLNLDSKISIPADLTYISPLDNHPPGASDQGGPTWPRGNTTLRRHRTISLYMPPSSPARLSHCLVSESRAPQPSGRASIARCSSSIRRTSMPSSIRGWHSSRSGKL